MYQCKHFDLREWVPPEIYVKRGQRAWELLDERILRAADRLRERVGRPVIINTWHSDKLMAAYGRRTQSGFRSPQFYVDLANGNRGDGLERYAASLSQHKFGRAFDCLVDGLSAEMVRQIVKEEAGHIGFTAIEDGVSWFHGDVRNCEQLKVFLP